jgi:hypothetical protein
MSIGVLPGGSGGRRTSSSNERPGAVVVAMGAAHGLPKPWAGDANKVLGALGDVSNADVSNVDIDGPLRQRQDTVHTGYERVAGQAAWIMRHYRWR